MNIGPLKVGLLCDGIIYPKKAAMPSATNIQSWTFYYIRLVNQHYANVVTLREQSLSLIDTHLTNLTVTDIEFTSKGHDGTLRVIFALKNCPFIGFTY